MKVALFTDTYLPQINGVTNTLSNLVQYYTAAGIEYKIFAPDYHTDEMNENVKRFHSMPFLLYPENRVVIPNTFRISSILSHFTPDIIHIMTESTLGIAGLNYGKKHHIPTISTYTTNFSQYANYYKMNFLKESIWNYLKWFHSQNTVTLCPSNASKELLKSHGIINTKLFSRGIDLNTFHPGKRSNELRKQYGITNKTVFLYVGRVSYEKDLDILCASYHEIAEKYKDEAILIVTGDGPYLESCKKIFPPSTIFTGYLRDHDLAKIYASSDIFVCPSSTETFGNVVLEAMACGLPVIGADTGGVGELISHRINGLTFAKRSIKGLTNCMEELIKDFDTRDFLKENGLEFASSRSWVKVFNGLMDIYEEVSNKYKKDTKQNHEISA